MTKRNSLQAMQAKRQILASRVSTAKMLNNEKSLERELSRFFQKLKKQVLQELETYYSEEFMFQAQADLILAPIFESQKEYYEIILKHIKKEYKNGVTVGKRLVNLSRRKTLGADKSSTILPLSSVFHRDELFGYNEWSANELYSRSFTASEGTMNRVDDQINKILSDGYKDGNGINSVGADITKRFDQLSDWESRRIARTEIHNAHNRGTMDIYNNMNVDYIQWGAALDDRTRDSHADINGEIIAIGDTFSNGLQYPGDTSGDIEEWINCRCSNMPFIMPEGYTAPLFSPFRESDLVSIERPDYSDLVEQATEELQSDSPYLQNIKDVLREATDTQGEYRDLMTSVEKFYESTKDAPVEMIGVLDYNKQLYKNVGFENNVPMPYEAIYQGITEGIYFSGHNHPNNCTCFQSYADFENALLCNEKYSYTVGKDGFFIIKNNNIDRLSVDDLPYNVADKYTATKMLVDKKKAQYEENGNPVLATYNEVHNQIVDDFNKQYSKEIDKIHKNAIVHNKEFGVDEVDFAKINREKNELFNEYMHKNIGEYTHILNSRLNKYNVNIYYAPKKR